MRMKPRMILTVTSLHPRPWPLITIMRLPALTARDPFDPIGILVLGDEIGLNLERAALAVGHAKTGWRGCDCWFRGPRSRQNTGFAGGMCPRNDESAGKRRSNRLRKGAPWLKTTLVQCAWAAVRKIAT